MQDWPIESIIGKEQITVADEVINDETLIVQAPEQTKIVITAEVVKTDYPQIYQEIFAAGMTAERERILAIDQLIPNAPAGSEETITKAKQDTTKTAKDLAFDLWTLFPPSQKPPAENQARVEVSDLEVEAPPAIETGEQTDDLSEDAIVKMIASANPIETN
jgi:hypothetical protein